MGKYLTILFSAFVVFTLALTPVADAAKGDSIEGRKLFATYCYLCHGLDGKGDGPLAPKMKVKPADLTSPALPKRTEMDLYSIIEGKEFRRLVSPEMPKWGDLFTGDKILSLASYVRFLRMSKNPVLGDPEAGGVIYGQYCSPCHGRKGKGNGVLNDFLTIKPADHTNRLKMDEMSNEEIEDIITNGRGKESAMPAWKDILTGSDIKNVVGYIRLLSH